MAALEQAVSQLAAATRDADDAMEALNASGKGFGDVLTKIGLAVRGINRIADAFGLLDDDVRRAIDSVLDLVNTLKVLEAAKGALEIGTVLGIAGAAVGGISALAGIVGGLFGGESKEDKRRAELLRQNSEALDLLRQEFARSLAVLEDIPGTEFAKALDFLSRGTTETVGSGEDDVNEVFSANLTAEQLAFLRELAKTLGVVFDISAEGFARLAEAIQELRLTELTESFTGALDLLQRRFALFDIDKPLDRVAAMLDLLGDFGDLDVAGLGVGNEAERAALEQFIKDIFEQIEGGTFDLSKLGDLTLDDLLNLLGNMEKLLDDIERDGVTGDDGLTENFIRSTRITEVQGNELLTLARTELVIERQQLAAQLDMVNLLGVMAAIAAPAPGATADVARATGTVNVGGVTVNATVMVTEEVDADAIVDRVGSQLAVVLDRELRELQTRENRAVGDVGRVA